MPIEHQADAAVDRHRRADESVAACFTRPMNAATSRWGLLCDPPFVAVTTAAILLAALGAVQLSAAAEAATMALAALVAAPTLVALGVTLRLRGARAELVGWLAGLPFPVDNMNTVLNGLGETLELQFVDATPAVEQVNPILDTIHGDCFVTDAKPGERRISVRIGVIDSKHNPHGSTYRRYVRTRQLVDEALVPLAQSFPIASVRVI